MIAKLYSSALQGVDAIKITIEVSVAKGIGYQITGLPDESIKESLSRIAVVIDGLGFHMPRTKIVINLAPAGVRKAGTAFDVAIALGILIASGQVHDLGKLEDYSIVGETGLDGNIYPVHGSLCMACQAKRDGFKAILVPSANAAQASLINGIAVYGVAHIREVLAFIATDCALDPCRPCATLPFIPPEHDCDFKDVKGQLNARRALEIAAAGGHNSLLIGPPGIGKTMLAKRLPSILPPMTAAESLETTMLFSLQRNTGPVQNLITTRSFRNPHHTASDIALMGGGSFPMPGEVSLAHNGVLFLDELPEFQRSAIEALRQPLEEGRVLIARSKRSVQYPASFMLVAAMNPCSCGYFGHPARTCTCSRKALYWYRRRISGPILERIDLHVEMEPVSLIELAGNNDEPETSEMIRNRVIRAREIQLKRLSGHPSMYCNAQMPDNVLDKYCTIDDHASKYLFKRMDLWQLSARSYCRILKVARTIADLKASKMIELSHVAEAFHFRRLDKPLEFKKDK